MGWLALLLRCRYAPRSRIFFLLLRREAALAAFEKDEDVYPWLFFSFTGHFVENAILAIHAMCCSMFSWSL